ncbi:hypothetical protein [Prochlorococcus sp. MIT 1318]
MGMGMGMGINRINCIARPVSPFNLVFFNSTRLKMTKGINLFTACFLFILAASLPQSIKAQPSKGITNNYYYYSPWSPGDAGAYADKDGYKFDPCMSRFPEDCEKKTYINLGKWQRISDEVMQTRKGTFFLQE